MKFDFLQDPEKLATFVTEYLRHDGKEDAGVLAVGAADIRHPQYLPRGIADYLLASPEIQAAIKAARSLYKPSAQKAVTAETIAQDMEIIYQRALDDRQYTAAIAAKKLQGEAAGVITKNIDINVKHTLTSMSDTELERIAKQAPIDGEFKDVTNVPVISG